MTMVCRCYTCDPITGGRRVSSRVKKGMKEFDLSNESLKKIMDLFLDNIKRGLKKETHPTSIVKCFPTYVQDLPTGKEKGKFFALDLGGTNFRVLMVDLDKGGDMKADVYVVPQEMTVGSAEGLFDHIAKCLADFAVKHGVQDEDLSLGFTFSFPLQQIGLRRGLLVRWTKGYNIPEVVGKDVVQLLHEAIERRGDVKIDVCAVLNDTTGTLMSCAWKNPTCRIGLIVGTGHNGCYVESQKNAEMFDEIDRGSGRVIINLEAAAFGDDGCLDWMRTDLDKQIDNDSINPGKQRFEKMISGMYLGELARLYTLRFIQNGIMFNGKHANVFEKFGIFETAYLSEIESDPLRTYKKCSEILQKIGISDASDQDMTNLRYICESISKRGAHLVAAMSCVLTEKVGEPKIIIGIDGSVYKYHPSFRQLMKDKMLELIKPGFEFDLMLSEDGSGRGAALVAAMAAIRAKMQDSMATLRAKGAV